MAASCQLTAQANGSTARQGGQEAILVTAAHNATISVALTMAATYPTTATLYSGFDTLAATSVAATADPTAANTQRYSAPTGPDGRAILVFPVPQDAPLGRATVQASDASGCSAGTGFTVAPAAAGAFTGSVFLALPHVLVRTPELPPLQGSIVHERVRVITAPGATVTTSAAISGSATALGTADDGGTAYANGAQFFQDTQTADANGSVFVSVPVSGTLLRPGNGARVLLHVDATSDGVTTEYRTSLALREASLRLLVRAAATTRGGRRPTVQLGSLSGGHSALYVDVMADRGAHLSGQAVFGANPTLRATATAGAGKRALLTFAVPNSYVPSGGHAVQARVRVTSTFRGSSLTRDVTLSYARR